jgi:hypothetical protein
MSGPLTWRGETFIDSSDLAAEAGTTRRNVEWHLRTHGNLDRLGQGQSRTKLPGSNPKAAPVTVAGQEFPSIRALARFTGRRLDTIRGWLVRKEAQKLEEAVRRARETTSPQEGT